MTIKLIIGLRNPGSSYEQTRHNAGGWFVEALARHYQVDFKIEKKLHAELGHFENDSRTCKLLLPLTFMNHSGLPTREVCQFYRIKPEEILVAHDELDLDAGRLKVKTGGGHGGHNGLRDIISHLGSNNFHRLRIGIGHPGHKDMVLNFVLGKPSQAEKLLIKDAIDRSLNAIPKILAGNMSLAMNLLNS